MRLLRTLRRGLVAGLLLFGSTRGQGQNVTALPHVELGSVTGTWYEIARYPDKWEKRCAGNAVLLISPADKANHLESVYACKTNKGYMDARNLDGKRQTKLEDGRFKLGSIWPFYRKLWVMAIAPDGEWMVAGSPNHKSLWIYSKGKTMSQDVLASVQAKAVEQGFSTAKMTIVPQDLP